MQQIIEADLAAEPKRVYAIVSDLTTYPQWLGLVSRVEPDGDSGWWVTLRSKLGPLTRSKRLRMERVIAEPDTAVRFERREADGREHANWVLDVAIAPPSGSPTRLTMNLSYDGGFWSRPLEAALRRQVADAVPRLEELVG